MKKFHPLEDWNKDRDFNRRNAADKALKKNGIAYICPSLGHFKIDSAQCADLMFYPKSGTVVWKEHKRGFQHRFQNDDEGKLMRKLKSLI